MKYGKKTMAIICAAVCALTPFALAACGGGDTPANNSTSGEVTAEQWKAAIKATKELKNYTETYSYVREDKYEGITRKGEYGCKYNNGIAESISKDAEQQRHFCIIKDNKAFQIDVENNSVSYITKKGWPCYDDTDVSALLKHKLSSGLSDEGCFYIQYENEAGESRLLEDHYNTFAYDSESKCYFASFYQDGYEYIDDDNFRVIKEEISIKIAINNNYLTAVQLDYDEGTEHYEFTNINKTSISVPEYVWTAIQEYKEEDLI